MMLSANVSRSRVVCIDFWHAFVDHAVQSGLREKEQAKCPGGTYPYWFSHDAATHQDHTWVQGGIPLKGWDFIQERILSHDEDMIADFADDIDTLLVFVSINISVPTSSI